MSPSSSSPTPQPSSRTTSPARSWPSTPRPSPAGRPSRGTPGTYYDAITGLSYEALWFNVSKAPLTIVAVRQALGYATDRDAIVKQLFAPIQPDIQPIQSFYTPAFGKVYTTPFSQVPSWTSNMVNTLMTGDGWAKGSDGIWAKGGQKAALELKTTTGNKRRAADRPDPAERVAAGRVPADGHARDGRCAVRPGRARAGTSRSPCTPRPRPTTTRASATCGARKNIPGAVQRQQRHQLVPDQRPRPGHGVWIDVDTNLDPTRPDRRRPTRVRPAGRAGAGASRSIRSRTSS